LAFGEAMNRRMCLLTTFFMLAIATYCDSSRAWAQAPSPLPDATGASSQGASPLADAQRRLALARLEIAVGGFLTLAAPPALITAAAFASMDAEYCEEDENPKPCQRKYDAVFHRYIVGLAVAEGVATLLVVDGIRRVIRSKRDRNRWSSADALLLTPRKDGWSLHATVHF
jgi:hypothetical protein